MSEAIFGRATAQTRIISHRRAIFAPLPETADDAISPTTSVSIRQRILISAPGQRRPRSNGFPRTTNYRSTRSLNSPPTGRWRAMRLFISACAAATAVAEVEDARAPGGIAECVDARELIRQGLETSHSAVSAIGSAIDPSKGANFRNCVRPSSTRNPAACPMVVVTKHRVSEFACRML
jgi:hypothetical protein